MKKGDIAPSEYEAAQKAVKTIIMIENRENDEMPMDGESHGYMRSYNRPAYYGSYGHPYGDSYGDYSRKNYRDSFGDEYHGESHRRGRSPVTGRYISRGTEYDMGYSGHSIQDRMVARLESMMDEAKTNYERQTVSDWINRLQGQCK